ncbi:MAG: cell envelope biogenesis protein TolA [Myxococcota bacterium]
MTFVIIALGLALAASLAFNFGLFGGKAASHVPAGEAPSRSDAQRDDDRPRKLETELEKKRKEVEELKKSQAELKEELKAAKKKLFEQKESERSGDDLAKARAEVERHASVQLENTRHELSVALAEVQRLKGELEGKGRRRPESTEKRDEPKAEKPQVQEVVQRVIRELSDVEKERIAKLEAQSSADRKRANELDRELRALKGKMERNQRESKRVYSEANLARDKFRAVEMRLNRTLLENDLLKRAIADLEKKTGLHAEHITLTPEEAAESDRAIKAKHAAEDQAEAEARARLEAAPVSEEATEAPPASAPEASAPATVAEPAPAASSPSA